MIIGRFFTNQLSREAYTWYLDYLDAFEAKNPYACAAYLAEESSFQMNSQPTVRGKAQVLRNLGFYWSAFGTLEHELLKIYGTDRAFVLESLNHYTREDGSPVTLRGTAFTDRDETGLVTSLRFYVDTTALYIRSA